MCANQAIKDKTDMILGFYPSRRSDLNWFKLYPFAIYMWALR